MSQLSQAVPAGPPTVPLVEAVDWTAQSELHLCCITILQSLQLSCSHDDDRAVMMTVVQS